MTNYFRHNYTIRGTVVSNNIIFFVLSGPDYNPFTTWSALNDCLVDENTGECFDAANVTNWADYEDLFNELCDEYYYREL